MEKELDPKSPSKISKESTYIGPQYQWEDFENRKEDRYAHEKYKLMLSWLGDLYGKKTLVVGAGSGEFACMLAQGGALVHCIDIDKVSADLVKRLSEMQGISLTAEVSTIEDFQSPEKFDLVVATDVIEHIENDRRACDAMMAQLNANGQVLISVPAGQWLFGHHDEILGHFRRYSKAKLVPLFSRVETLHCRYFGFFLIPIVLLFSKFLRKPYPVSQVGRAAQRKMSVISLVSFVVFKLEQFSYPLGSSLLYLGRKSD